MNLIFNRIRSFYFKNKIDTRKIDAPKITFSDIWKGDPNLGSKINNSKDPINEIKEFDTFNFIRDLKSFDTLKSRATCRKLVNYWIDLNINFFSESYNGNLTANRICVMCQTYSWFAGSGEINFQKKVLRFIYIQLELQANYLKKKKIYQNFKVIKSLIIGNIFLFNDNEKTNLYLSELYTLSKKLILSDGGHISRCPMEQLDCLRDLIEIRACVASLKNVDTLTLHDLVRSMGDYFKIFCVKKNTFCTFNSGSLVNKKTVNETLKRLTSSKDNFRFARDSGYACISFNNIDLIIDTGNKKILTSDYIYKNKASITAFELFYSNSKIVTSMGTPYYNRNNSLQFNAIASTTAHSTMSIDNENNLDLSKKRKVEYLSVKSSENNHGYLISIEHDGYKDVFGIIHTRTFFISKEDQDFRGEDIILNYGNFRGKPNIATLRFHLHNDIKPIKLQNGNILLQNSENKIIGTFYSSAKTSKIQETLIYEGTNKSLSNQIVIELSIKEIREVNKIIVKWSFKFGNLN